MDFQVLYTQPAIDDLAAIIQYTAITFPGTAQRFGASLLNHVDLLADFPRMGSLVANMDGVRQLVHTPVLIYYRVVLDRKLVTILHIWHSSRKPPSL